MPRIKWPAGCSVWNGVNEQILAKQQRTRAAIQTAGSSTSYLKRQHVHICSPASSSSSSSSSSSPVIYESIFNIIIFPPASWWNYLCVPLCRCCCCQTYLNFSFSCSLSPLLSFYLLPLFLGLKPWTGRLHQMSSWQASKGSLPGIKAVR